METLVGFAYRRSRILLHAPRLETRFNSDGTWQDDQGGKGTWQIENNQLTVIDDTGEIRKMDVLP